MAASETCPASPSGLHEDPTCVVDAVEVQVRTRVLEILINRLPGPLPVAIIVNDKDAMLGQPRIQVMQFVQGRRVPIGVQPQQRNLIGNSSWNGVLDLALHKVHALAWIPSALKIGPHVLDRRLAPNAMATRIPPKLILRSLAIETLVGIRWRAHAFVGVVQIELPLHISTPKQRQRARHHAAATPNPTLHDVASNPVPMDVVDGSKERSAPLETGHREGTDALHDLPIGDVKIREVKGPRTLASKGERVSGGPLRG